VHGLATLMTEGALVPKDADVDKEALVADVVEALTMLLSSKA
jgi:hypothetical protein